MANSKFNEHSCPCRDLGRIGRCALALLFLHLLATVARPFCMKEQKALGHDFSKIPNGAPGIETRMSLV
jgi:hypothetical protein